MPKICVVYYSHFKGTTAVLAEAIKRGCDQVPDTTTQLIRVEDADSHWQDLHAADGLIFGSPTYIGSVAAVFKAFMEQLAGEAWLQRLWVNKIAGGFTVSAGRSGDKLVTLQQMQVFAAQMGMIWVPLRITGGNYSSAGSEADLNRMAGYLGVMAQANIDEPTSAAPPASDIATAEMHGNHIAQVTRQFVHGRRALPADYDTYALEPPQATTRPATLAELLGQTD